MSHELLEERVGKVEGELSRLSSDVRLQGHDLATLKKDVGKIAGGVETLIQRDASRREPLNAKVVAASLSAVVAAGGLVWWLIGQSPAVQELQTRTMRLDDPEIGRVKSLEDGAAALGLRIDRDAGRIDQVERRLDAMPNGSWAPRVTRLD